jgi:hypothetical protein
LRLARLLAVAYLATPTGADHPVAGAWRELIGRGRKLASNVGAVI